MHLQIYSLKNTLFDGEVTSINCKTASGEITVLDGHRPLLTMLGIGIIKITDKGQKEKFIQASGGFLEVLLGNKARMIVEENPNRAMNL